jgi:hypothetical protein
VAAVAVAWVVAPPAGAAEDGSQVAREYNRQAVEAFKAGDYETALHNFELAFQLLPDARVRLNLGMTNENLGRLDEARLHYQAYLRENPRGDKSAAVKDLLTGVHDRMRRWGKVVVVVQPGPARVTVGGLPAGGTPAARWVEPGRHAVVVRQEGYQEVTHDVVVTPGLRMEVKVNLVAESPSSPPAPAGASLPTASSAPALVASVPVPGAESAGPSVLPWVARGVGGAVLASGILPALAGALGGMTSLSTLVLVLAVNGTDPYRAPLTGIYWLGWAALGLGVLGALLAAATGSLVVGLSLALR